VSPAWPPPPRPPLPEPLRSRLAAVPRGPPAARIAALRALLDDLGSRGRLKAFGAEVDAHPALRAALDELAGHLGLPTEADWPGKKLARLLVNHAEDAHQLGTLTRRDEAFPCAWCGAFVPPGGARVRDHCPFCLRGLHLDVVPGDRAADCGGVLHPTGFSLEGRAGVVIAYACAGCGLRWRGRAHPDDQLPEGLRVEDLPGAGSGAGRGGGAEAEALDRARALPLRVLEQIRRGRLWSPGDRVLLAVSGGLDSLVLMELMVQLQGGHGASLEVASVDHGLRPEAVAEVAQVGRRARELGLPFWSLSVQLDPGPDLAARARDARRAALLGVGADRVCTGHHEDDQAETVLQRLLRGAGSAGLGAMAPAHGPWRRPLLGEARSTLEAWARSRGLRWADDPSNATSERGRLRALWPELEALRPGSRGAMARSARLLAADDALLEQLAAAEGARLARPDGLDAGGLAALPLPLGLRLLRGLAPDAHAEALERALAGGLREGAWLDAGQGAGLEVRGGVLRQVKALPDGAPP
jgi:tRNA(Ile)-lysidine synthase